MKFFLDSANVEEIKEMNQTGLIDGVTTNPTLIAKSGQDIKTVIANICKVIAGPVSAEVAATTYEGMLNEGLALHKIAPQVVVKVPLTFDGLKVCHTLKEQNISVNVTLCFSATQALLAAKAGARYISPFVGRLDDIGYDGLILIEDICHIYQNYSSLKTEILVASVRHPVHVLQAAKLGADVVTLPVKIFKQLYEHPLTMNGLQTFLSDWAATGQSIL